MSTVELTPVFRGAARPVIRAEVDLALVADSSPDASPDASPTELRCTCVDPAAGSGDRPVPAAVAFVYPVLLSLLALPVVLLVALLIAAAAR
jgi:hypothetical protein